MLQLANTLRDMGIEAELDQYHIRPALGWPRWCEELRRPENADWALLICPRNHRQRVEGKTASDEGGSEKAGSLIAIFTKKRAMVNSSPSCYREPCKTISPDHYGTTRLTNSTHSISTTPATRLSTVNRR